MALLLAALFFAGAFELLPGDAVLLVFAAGAVLPEEALGAVEEEEAEEPLGAGAVAVDAEGVALEVVLVLPPVFPIEVVLAGVWPFKLSDDDVSS